MATDDFLNRHSGPAAGVTSQDMQSESEPTADTPVTGVPSRLSTDELGIKADAETLKYVAWFVFALAQLHQLTN